MQRHRDQATVYYSIIARQATCMLVDTLLVRLTQEVHIGEHFLRCTQGLAGAVRSGIYMFHYVYSKPFIETKFCGVCIASAPVGLAIHGPQHNMFVETHDNLRVPIALVS